MQRIDKDFGLPQFEDSLRRLNAGDTELLIAHGIKAEAVGAAAALLQLLATWGRGPDARLRVYANGLDDPALTRFAETPAGVAAFNMADSVRTRSGAAISRRDALTLSEAYVRAMHEGDLRALKQRNSITLLCIDNARHLGRPLRLYDIASDTVRPARDLADLLRAALDVLAVSRLRLKQAEPVLGDASAILFEAFQNTHEHARTDFRGDQLPRSTRGVSVGWRYVEADRLPAAATGHLLLERYFAGWRLTRPAAKHAQFLELSVVDSGSGLAQTWLAGHGSLREPIRNSTIDLDDELAAVHACLRKGGTTKSNRTAGNGLYRILALTHRHGGFFRLRTGRLSVGRAFPRAEEPAPDNLVVHDLRSGEPIPVPQPWAEGTVLTVMLPLDPERPA